jgi:ribose 5-phosphate isomerase A
MSKDNLKRNIGRLAVETLVESGMKLGLGSGSTAVEAVRRIGELVRTGELKNLRLVPTSFQTEEECRRAGLVVSRLNDPDIDAELDLSIDGADEIDPEWNLIKGGGGALLSEKIVARASLRYCIVADASKRVRSLGQEFPVPVEVVPEALALIIRELEKLGAKPELRQAVRKAGPVVTDHGNLILDARFSSAFTPADMERLLNSIPGVVENGIFTHPVTDLFVGARADQIEHLKRP